MYGIVCIFITSILQKVIKTARNKFTFEELIQFKALIIFHILRNKIFNKIQNPESLNKH